MLDNCLEHTGWKQKDATLFDFISTLQKPDHKMFSTPHFIYTTDKQMHTKSRRKVHQNVNNDYIRNDCSLFFF